MEIKFNFNEKLSFNENFKLSVKYYYIIRILSITKYLVFIFKQFNFFKKYTNFYQAIKHNIYPKT